VNAYITISLKTVRYDMPASVQQIKVLLLLRLEPDDIKSHLNYC